MRKNMIRQCCICGVVYGEKEPFEDKSVTHGLCKKCFKREMKKLEGTGRKKNPPLKIINENVILRKNMSSIKLFREVKDFSCIYCERRFPFTTKERVYLFNHHGWVICGRCMPTVSALERSHD